jgi:hypothetical protein
VRENEMLEVPQRAAQLSNGVESMDALPGKPASTMTSSGPLSRMNALTDQEAVKTAHPIAHPDGYFWRLDKSFTHKYFVCTQELRLDSLVHTQEVTGSSPVAPTIRINRLRPHIPEKASTTSMTVGGQLGGLIFLRTSR